MYRTSTGLALKKTHRNSIRHLKKRKFTKVVQQNLLLNQKKVARKKASINI